MSTRLPLQPKADGWIPATKKEKQPTQRPLVGPNVKVHTGIYTPPASTSRKRSAPASNLSSSQRKKPRSSQHATPTAPPIRTLDTFLTPPTTTGKEPRAKRKPPRSSLGPEPTKSLSDEAISKWLSRPPQRTPQTECSKPSQARSKLRTRSPSKSKSPAKAEPRTPDEPSSSPRDITQCPPSVLARHQRLCGQDSARKRATRSPWREITEEDEAAELEERRADRQLRAEKLAEEKERKRLRLDVREAVQRQAKERVEGARERRALGKFKSLVHLSSESSSPPRSSSSPSGGSKRSALRPYSSAIEEPVCERETQWPKPPALPSSKLAAMPEKRSTSPWRPYLGRPRETSSSPTKHISPQRQGSERRGRPSEQGSPGVATPRKPKTHHFQVTPPKSRTPQGNQAETLFVYPLPKPPAQPVFVPVPRPVTEWRPVEMEAETLMTWSLGGGGVSVERPVDLPPSDPPLALDQPLPSSDLSGSDPRELPPSDPPLAQPQDQPPDQDLEDETQSIAPSVPSQTFPELITSSPAQHSPSPARRKPGFPFFSSPRRSPRLSVSPAKKLVRRAGSPKRVNDAIFASLGSDTPKAKPPPVSQKRASNLSSDTPKAKPPPSQKRAPRRSSQKETDAQQTKLDVFGYFPQKTRRAKEFDTAFSDEEDLFFGDEVDDWAPRPTAPDLRPVPEAPPHPSLRDAGRRELAKRDAEAFERHRSQQRPATPRTPYTDSSSLTDDGPQTSESTRRWFAGLGTSLSQSSDL